MEAYAGKQFVGIDLHRRRTVIVRTTEGGEVLETVRIVNDVERLASVMARAGSVRRWCWRPPTAGTGLWMRCRPVVPACTWLTLWGSRRLSTGGSRTTCPRRDPSRGLVADGAPARGVDRTAGHQGAA